MRHYCFNNALFGNLLLGYDCCLIELRLISFEFRSIVLQLWRACLGRLTHLARLTMSSYSSMEHLTVRREITGCTHYVTFTTIFLVHVAQWLEHLTGHQKVTGCTHNYITFTHPFYWSIFANSLTVQLQGFGCQEIQKEIQNQSEAWWKK